MPFKAINVVILATNLTNMSLYFNKRIIISTIILCFFANLNNRLYAQDTLNFPQKDTSAIAERYQFIEFTNNRQTFKLQHPDTSLYNFHLYNPASELQVPYHFLGNMGQPYLPLLFSYHRAIGFEMGIHVFSPYQFNAKTQIPYFFSAYPFTQINYVIGSAQEQVIAATFSQNIKKQFRIALNYRRITAPGTYNHQKTGYHNLVFSTWYQHPNQKLNVLSHFLYNETKAEQNGGVAVNNLFDTVNFIQKNIIPVNFTHLQYVYKQSNFLFQSSYDGGKYFKQTLNDTLTVRKFLPLQRIGYAFNFNAERWRFADTLLHQTFCDNNSLTPNYQQYYAFNTSNHQFENEVFIALFGKKKQYLTKTIADSLTISKQPELNDTANNSPSLKNVQSVLGLSNTDTLKINENTTTLKAKNKKTFNYAPENETWEQSFNLRAYFKHQYNQLTANYLLNKYLANCITDTLNTTQIIIDTTLIKKKYADNWQNGIIGGVFENNKGKFKYHLNTEYVLFGYNAFDFNAEAKANLNINKKIGELIANFFIARQKPNYIENNHITPNDTIENRNLKKLNVLQFGGQYYSPFLKLTIAYQNYSILNLPILNADTTFSSLNTLLNVNQFTIKKDFNYKSFYNTNEIYLQSSNNTKVQLPNLVSKHRFYFQNWLFNFALLTSIGVDVQFNTNYYASMFNLPTMQFYSQNITKQKYYPVLDVFVNAKVKRARFFLTFQHLNEGWIKQKGYFAALNYPAQGRMFKFGVSWMFYD